MNTNYKIQFFGVMGDTWYGGQTYASREEARSMVRFLNTKEHKVSGINRGVYKYAKVVEA